MKTLKNLKFGLFEILRFKKLKTKVFKTNFDRQIVRIKCKKLTADEQNG